MTNEITSTSMDIHEILDHLPHRYPFVLIDRVLSMELGKEITAIKNVTINEPFFPGHFPYHPVMPGVLIVEAMAQAAAVLSFKTTGLKPSEDTVYYFAGIDKARFKKPVIPGDRLELKVAIDRIIRGTTSIGRNNQIYPFCSLGEAPQDKKYKGEPTALEIGDDNTIRESCTLNRGTVQDVGVTRIGNDNWIMAYVHIAHDCQIGNHTIFANGTTLGGHVHVDDYAILGGFTMVHQFCKIGAHIITAGGSVLFKDVPPYVMAAGYDAKPHGINAEGLKRRGFSAETTLWLKRAYKTLYKSGLT